MTRPLFDLHALVNANFVHTNVQGATIENLSADPEIEIRTDFMTTPVARNSNGNIVFTKETEVQSNERGEFRDEVFMIDLYIYYESLVKVDDATINAIKSELRRVLNVNNFSSARSWEWLVKSSDYNGVPHIGRIDMTIQSTKADVSATA